MSPKITVEIVDDFLNCRLKAYLRLAGQQGVKSDYEAMQIGIRQQVRQTATQKIRNRYNDNAIAIGTPVTYAGLKDGTEFLLDAKLNDDCYLMDFDGLKKVDGSSDLGTFHYVPVLFAGAPRIRQSHRYFLEVLGLVLSSAQGKTPGSGIVYHGHECEATTVRFPTDLKIANAFV